MRRVPMGAGAAVGVLLAAWSRCQRRPQARPPAAAASDGPGTTSHFDLARKDCLGTAQNRKSKVWYTVADGVLSDVYYPTVDNTNVETLQYVVTDGSSFTDLQTRDMTYKVSALDDGGMACRVTTTARNGRYRIVTDYVTDPARPAVVTSVTFIPLVGSISDYHLYVRFDPTVNGNGGGGGGNGGADTGAVDTSTGSPVPVASDSVTATNAANRDYAQPVFAALDASTPFLQVTNGYAGQASDGLVQLDASHALTESNDSAAPGNLVQTAEVTLPANGTFELALGLGADQAGAVKTAASSLRKPFAEQVDAYTQTWAAYDAGLNRPDFQGMGATRKEAAKLRSTYLLSANVLKASEDKTFPGAIVAGLASPWGQAVSAGDPANTYFGSYREVFARDLYEAYTGLLADGDLATAKDATEFLFNRQQLPDGSMPRNSLVNGKTAPDSFNTQLDEVAYPILMAYQLGLTSKNLYVNHIKRAANYVAAHGPAAGPERWEEQDGYSPSTIAAEIAGLLAAANIADVNHDAVSAAVWRGVADDYQRSIKGWAVTTNGPLADHPYFIRLSKTGDPNAAITYNVGNGGPTLDQREVIDAGFLELSRLGELAADDPDILQSLPVVDDARSRRSPRAGRGWHRYNGDGYGDGAADGHPWAPSDMGTGHLWPVLSAERGAHDLQLGQSGDALDLLVSMSCFASGVGLIPEQDWELPDLRRLAVGHRPDDGLDRVRERRPGRLGGAAHVVRRRVRAAGQRPRPEPADRAAAEHRRPLRGRHPGRDDAHPDRPARPVGDHRLAGDRDRHRGAGRRDLGGRHQRRRVRHANRCEHRRCRRLVPREGAGRPRHHGAERGGHGARRRHRPRPAHGRLGLRPRPGAARRGGSRRRRQRPGQLRLSDVGQLQAGRLRPAALPGHRRRRRHRLPRPDP